MGAIASQITSLPSVYSTVYSDAGQRKHQSSASLALVWGFHRGPVNSPHKWPVTRKMFPFDDVIMICYCLRYLTYFQWRYIWRCSHVVRHALYEWFFCYNWQELCHSNKLLYFSGTYCFWWNTLLKYQNQEWAVTPSPVMLICVAESQSQFIFGNS